jgi:hypothetical protein
MGQGQVVTVIPLFLEAIFLQQCQHLQAGAWQTKTSNLSFPAGPKQLLFNNVQRWSIAIHSNKSAGKQMLRLHLVVGPMLQDTCLGPCALHLASVPYGAFLFRFVLRLIRGQTGVAAVLKPFDLHAYIEIARRKKQALKCTYDL